MPVTSVVRRLPRFGIALMLLVLVFGSSGAGQAAPGNGRVQPTSRAATGDAALGNLLDPVIARAMAAGHVPGAAVVVVQDGATTYAKGYGQADVARREPVSPTTTIFHAMSVSKLFTALAVVQLAEQGRVELHADANRYLRGVQIAPTYPLPVTLDQLLTHTAGFDGDQVVGVVARTPAAVPTLDQYLTAHPPLRLQPPGERYRYSNADFDVLGAVIEGVTGEPFDQYMAERILGPLGMSSASFRQTDGATPSYAFAGGAYRSLPPHFFGNMPSRGLTTSTEDMARFIAALLPGATPGSPRPLDDSTLAALLAQHFTYGRGEPGMAYGFQEFADWASGLRVLWKDGRDDIENNCMLVLLPDRRVGWFVAVNADDGEQLAHAVYGALLAHYAPAPALPSPPAAVADSRADARRVEGTYRDTNYSHRTLAKLLLLTNGDGPSFQATRDGQLQVALGGPAQTALVESAPLLFTTTPQPDGISHYRFLTDQQGRVDAMAIGAETYERVPWYGTVRDQEGLFGAFLLAFLAAVVAWLAGALRRRAWQPALRGAALLRNLPALIGMLDLIFLTGLFLALRRPYDLGLEYAVPGWLIGLLLLPILAALLTLALVGAVVAAWRDRALSRGAWAWSLAFTAVAIAFLPFLASWNLLGFRW